MERPTCHFYPRDSGSLVDGVLYAVATVKGTDPMEFDAPLSGSIDLGDSLERIEDFARVPFRYEEVEVTVGENGTVSIREPRDGQ